ncbi:MAG: hypothetical protein KY475_10745 [Planctomycetes bacterium]|nr:hypothetical protein [Planctomycetota bacterium]
MKSLSPLLSLAIMIGWGCAISIGPGLSANEKSAVEVDGSQAESLSDLTGPWQLVVDDYLIESQSGLTRRYHSFRKFDANPLDYKFRKIGRGTAIPDANGHGYRKWVNANSMITSCDGFHWGLSVRLKWDNQESLGNISIIHTPWDRDREFKMIGAGHDPVQRAKKDPLNKGSGRYGAYSSDGIHWRSLSTDPLFPDRSDTGLFAWDGHSDRYFGAPKIWTHVRGFQRRCVGLSASEDFLPGWPTAELILVPDLYDDRWVKRPGQRTEFYSLSPFTYESMYMGFLEVFRNTDGWKDGPIFIELVTSRDGLHWQRAGDRKALLPNGPPGTWDAGMVKVPNQPLVEGDRIKLFYYGSSQTHGFARKEYETYGREDQRKQGMGLATLRKDGFASLDAGEKIGTFTTKVLSNPSGVLRVNFKTNGGWLKVELLDAAGQPLPGYSLDECLRLRGDSVDHAVTWKEHKTLPRRRLRLRFQMQNGSIFAFAAGPDLKVDSVLPELAVLYTFEESRDRWANDCLEQDGKQSLYFHNAVLIDQNHSRIGRSAKAAFGNSEAIFLPQNSEHARKLISQTAYKGSGYVPWTYLEIDGTFRLGEQFTLAAFVKPQANGKMRLLSSWEPFAVRVNEPPYERDGEVGMKELLFDIDSGGNSPFGCMRLVVHGKEIQAQGKFHVGEYHHLAATYDKGLVKLYLDGRQAGAGAVPGGPVSLLTNLHVAGDPGPFTNGSTGTAAVDQFVGLVDDLLVLGRVLAPEHIRQLSQQGAGAFCDVR